MNRSSSIFNDGNHNNNTSNGFGDWEYSSTAIPQDQFASGISVEGSGEEAKENGYSIIRSNALQEKEDLEKASLQLELLPPSISSSLNSYNEKYAANKEDKYKEEEDDQQDQKKMAAISIPKTVKDKKQPQPQPQRMGLNQFVDWSKEFQQQRHVNIPSSSSSLPQPIYSRRQSKSLGSMPEDESDNIVTITTRSGNPCTTSATSNSSGNTAPKREYAKSNSNVDQHLLKEEESSMTAAWWGLPKSPPQQQYQEENVDKTSTSSSDDNGGNMTTYHNQQNRKSPPHLLLHRAPKSFHRHHSDGVEENRVGKSLSHYYHHEFGRGRGTQDNNDNDNDETGEQFSRQRQQQRRHSSYHWEDNPTDHLDGTKSDSRLSYNHSHHGDDYDPEDFPRYISINDRHQHHHEPHKKGEIVAASNTPPSSPNPRRRSSSGGGGGRRRRYSNSHSETMTALHDSTRENVRSYSSWEDPGYPMYSSSPPSSPPPTDNYYEETVLTRNQQQQQQQQQQRLHRSCNWEEPMMKTPPLDGSRSDSRLSYVCRDQELVPRYASSTTKDNSYDEEIGNHLRHSNQRGCHHNYYYNWEGGNWEEDEEEYNGSIQRSDSFISPSYSNQDYSRKFFPRRSSSAQRERLRRSYSTDAASTSMMNSTSPLLPPTISHDGRSRSDNTKMMTTNPTKTKTITDPNGEIEQSLSVEVAPGIIEPLRGARETTLAMEMGNITETECICCTGVRVRCISNAAYMICPTCKVINRVQQKGISHQQQQPQGEKNCSPSWGVGLGFL